MKSLLVGLAVLILSLPTFAEQEEIVILDNYYSVGEEIVFSAGQRLAKKGLETTIDDSEKKECVLRHDEVNGKRILPGTRMKIQNVEKYSYKRNSWGPNNYAVFIDIVEVRIKLESSFNLSINCYNKLRPGSVYRNNSTVFTRNTSYNVPTPEDIQDFFGSDVDFPY